MIPKVIHYCWFGGNPMSDNLKRCIDSWSRIMPDYEIKRWDENNYDVNKCDYMKEAYEAKKYPFVSDYARLDICCLEGGIYLDVDVEALKPFDDLLELEGFCGFERYKQKRGENVGVASGLVLALSKEQKMGQILRDDYHSRHFKNPDGSYDLTPCPKIQTPLLKQYGLQLHDETQTISGLTVFASEYFAPLNVQTDALNITPNTYSVHHYESSWCRTADLERKQLRLQYGEKHGYRAANIMSTFVAYKKHFGLIGMWKEIFEQWRENG